VLTEPRVDRGALLRAIRELYGMPFEELQFIPLGWTSAC